MGNMTDKYGSFIDYPFDNPTMIARLRASFKKITQEPGFQESVLKVEIMLSSPNVRKQLKKVLDQNGRREKAEHVRQVLKELQQKERDGSRNKNTGGDNPLRSDSNK